MNKKDMKKFFVIQYIIIGLLIILCLFLFLDRNDSSSTEENNKASVNNSYDISDMNEVSVTEILNMFEDGNAYLLYIGRETCGVCKAILPNLKAAQEELGYITQYLDITKVDRTSDDWKKLEKLLDVETNMNVINDKGEKELKTDTYGYFIGKYGYTPSLIIINNNIMVDAHIGNFDLVDLKEWLQVNGIG